MSKIWKNNDIIGSADAQRWEDKADSKDLQDLQDKIETEGVDTAKRLKTGRQIALSGHVSGSTVFDGSQNVNISTTIANASTSGRGLVQLSNDTNSTKENVAATSKAVSYKADKSVAQMFKLTKDDGYATLKSNDANECTECGFYILYTPINGPQGWSKSVSCMLLVISYRKNFLTQIIVAPDNKIAIRHGGTTPAWTDWVELTNVSDLSKKADIDKAQMWKITKDNGNIEDFKNGDCNKLIESGIYLVSLCANVPPNAKWYFVYVFANNANLVSQLAITSANEMYYRVKVGQKWFEWQQLTTTDDLAKTQMHKLTQDDGFDTFLDNVNIDSVKDTGFYYINNVVIKGKRYNGYLQIQAHADTYVKQTFTDYQSGVTFVRVLSANSWVEWQKLGGIDAKIYDIVMTGGIKPSKYAREYDNKIVVYDGVAHLKLNLDATKASTARIFIPKEVAIQVKSNPTTYHDGNIHMNSAAVGWARYETEDDKKTLKVINHEAEKEMLWLNIPNAGYDWVTATDLRVRNYNQKTDHHVGYFSWYVGGVN